MKAGCPASILFIFHAIILQPFPSLSFHLQPSQCLDHMRKLQPLSVCYAVAFVIAVAFVLQDRRRHWPMPERSVASVLALCHLEPLNRAAHRSWRGQGTGRALPAQPWSHVLVRVVAVSRRVGRGGDPVFRVREWGVLPVVPGRFLAQSVTGEVTNSGHEQSNTYLHSACHSLWRSAIYFIVSPVKEVRCQFHLQH